MSNIIRSSQTSPSNVKKIIQTKKIVKKPVMIPEVPVDPIVKKQHLQQEITILEQQFHELQLQLREQQENAQETIEEWWEEKQKEAEQYAESLAEEAARNGFDAGFQQGKLEAEQTFREKHLQLEELIQLAYEEKDKIIQSSESFLLSLSVHIAEKIVKNELAQDHEKLIHIVRQALKQIEETEDITIQVAPEDYPVILPFIEELQTYVRAESELKVIPASNLSSGGCMIHTANGSYDVTTSGQLDEIKKQLLAHFEEKTSDEHKDR